MTEFIFRKGYIRHSFTYYFIIDILSYINFFVQITTSNI